MVVVKGDSLVDSNTVVVGKTVGILSDDNDEKVKEDI